jgi:hypothetical protein
MATRWWNWKGRQPAPGTFNHSRMPMEKKVWWGFGVANIRETIQKPPTAEKLAGALEKILSEQPARLRATGK